MPIKYPVSEEFISGGLSHTHTHTWKKNFVKKCSWGLKTQKQNMGRGGEKILIFFPY